MGELFPDGWLKKTPDVSKMDPHAVDADRWDHEDLNKMLKDMGALHASRQRLGEFADTGAEALDDAFWAMLKAEPEIKDSRDVRPSHLVNRQIVEEMLNLPETERLRRYSVNDDVQAAMSAAIIEPDLETLFDRTAKAREKAQELQDALVNLAEAQQGQADIDEMVERWGEQNPEQPTPEEMQAAQEAAAAAAQAAQEAAEAAGEAFDQEMGGCMPGVSQSLTDMMGKAADDAQESQESARAWGIEPGQLQRMNAQERMALAKKLNNPRFKRIADLFGPMRNMMISEQQRKTTHHKEEIYDVGIGNDLARVLPQEVINLRPGPTRLDFLRRYTEGKLLQYEMQGTEKLARGAIILLEDGSGSMKGEREMWAKAVMLCLLHLARQQNRAFHLVHFGSPGQQKVLHFEKPEDFSFDRIIEAAELFFNGGTDFATPMTSALGILKKEFAATGRVTADVVMLTDGECYVQPAFMKSYHDEMDKMQATTWGVLIAETTPMTGSALMDMTGGKVATVQRLLDGGDIRQVFRGI